jgi:hypothetical protein
MISKWQNEFDDGSAARGQDYFDRSKVGPVRVTDGEVTALVKGTRRSPYTVIIDPYAPLDAWCSCPVEYRCKHIYAAILTLLEPSFPDTDFQDSLIEGLEDDSYLDLESINDDSYISLESPKLRLLQTNEPAEQVIKLSSKPVDEIAAFRTGHRTGSPASDSGMPEWVSAEYGASHRLVFLVGAGRIGSGTGRDRPLVYPARQYLRKDGLWGRIERIKAGAFTSAPDKQARTLAEKLLIQGGSGMLILFVADLEECDVPVFIGDPGGLAGVHDKPVTIVRPRKAVASLVPRLADRYSHTDLELDINLALESAEGQLDVTRGSRMSFDTGLGLSVAAFGDGTLIVDPVGGFLDVLHGSQTYGGTIPQNRVPDLVSGFDRLDDRFELQVPSRIRIIAQDLQPLLVFTSDYGRYASQLLLEFENPGLELDGMHGDEYVLHRVRKPGTDSIIADVSDVVRRTDRNDYFSDRVFWRLEMDSVEFAITHGAQLLELGYTVLIRDDYGEIRRLRRPPAPPRITISSGVDWFDLHVTIEEEGEIDWTILGELIEKGSLATGDSIVFLDEKEIDRLRAAMDLVDDTEDGRIRKQNIGALTAIAELADQIHPDVESIRAFAASLTDPAKQDKTPIPSGLTGELRHYQEEGFRWLARLASHGLSGCLADDMGLGKLSRRSLSCSTCGPALRGRFSSSRRFPPLATGAAKRVSLHPS